MFNWQRRIFNIFQIKKRLYLPYCLLAKDLKDINYIKGMSLEITSTVPLRMILPPGETDKHMFDLEAHVYF